jgi:hypothetical protein
MVVGRRHQRAGCLAAIPWGAWAGWGAGAAAALRAAPSTKQVFCNVHWALPHDRPAHRARVRARARASEPAGPRGRARQPRTCWRMWRVAGAQLYVWRVRHAWARRGLARRHRRRACAGRSKGQQALGSLRPKAGAPLAGRWPLLALAHCWQALGVAAGGRRRGAACACCMLARTTGRSSPGRAAARHTHAAAQGRQPYSSQGPRAGGLGGQAKQTPDGQTAKTGPLCHTPHRGERQPGCGCGAGQYS